MITKSIAAIVGITLFGGVVGQPPNAVHAGGAIGNDTVIPLTEGFEDGRGSFTSDTTGCSTSSCSWQVVTSHAYTGTRAAYLEDVGQVANYSIVSDALAIPVDATAATLTFWHLFDFEYNDNLNANYDGGVLEVSSDGGTSWVDAGAHITLGGYNGTIAIGLGNPLAGRAAWVTACCSAGIGRRTAGEVSTKCLSE